MKKPTKTKTRSSIKALVVVQSLAIVYFVYQMAMQYVNDVWFRAYVDTTFGKYLNSLVFLTAGAAGLGGSLAWVIVTYRNEQSKTGAKKEPHIGMPKFSGVRVAARNVLSESKRLMESPLKGTLPSQIPQEPVVTVSPPISTPATPATPLTPMRALIAKSEKDRSVRAARDATVVSDAKMLNTQEADTPKP
jgi:hypothetical protein